MSNKPTQAFTEFQGAISTIPLTDLDSNFTKLSNVVNDANSYSNYAADSGTANNYAVTLSGVTTTYTAGLKIQFKAANSNTGASTLNVNGQGTKSITNPTGSALAANSIVGGTIVEVIYDGTKFQLMSYTALSGLTGGLVTKKTDNSYVSRSIAVSGTGLSVSNPAGDAGNPTITSNAASINTASTIVARDGSGNFAAGTITATLSGNATASTTATNIAAGTAGSMPYQSAPGTTGFTAAGAAGQYLISNGTGVPTWTSAAAFTSGTIVGATVNNTSVGATTPSTGAFTSLSASGAVTFTSGTINGITIGATTPSTGKFTTLQTTSTTTIGNQLGLGGANYGSVGQVLVSNGAGAAPSWATVSPGTKSQFNSACSDGDFIFTSDFPWSSNGSPGVTKIAPDGQMEVSRYLDFHPAGGDSSDYTVRLDGGPAGSTTLYVIGNFGATGNVSAPSVWAPTVSGTNVSATNVWGNTVSGTTVSGTTVTGNNLLYKDMGGGYPVGAIVFACIRSGTTSVAPGGTMSGSTLGEVGAVSQEGAAGACSFSFDTLPGTWTNITDRTITFPSGTPVITYRFGMWQRTA